MAWSLLGLRPTAKTETHSGHPFISVQLLRLAALVTKLKSLLDIILTKNH